MDTKNRVTWQEKSGLLGKKKDEKKNAQLKMLFEFCAHFTPDRNILRHPGGGSIEKSQTQWVEWWRNILLPQKFAHPCQSFFYARAYKTFIVSVDVFSALTLRPKIANGLCSTGRAGVKGFFCDGPQGATVVHCGAVDPPLRPRLWL